MSESENFFTKKKLEDAIEELSKLRVLWVVRGSASTIAKIHRGYMSQRDPSHDVLGSPKWEVTDKTPPGVAVLEFSDRSIEIWNLDKGVAITLPPPPKLDLAQTFHWSQPDDG